MAATCPNGHQSATDDYCDTCGAPIGGSASPPATGSPSPGAGSPPGSASPAGSSGAGSSSPAAGSSSGAESPLSGTGSGSSAPSGAGSSPGSASPLSGAGSLGAGSASGAGSGSSAPSGAGSASGSPGSATGGSQQACPHCGAENAGDALFCEDCGYDFTTGQAPPAEQPLAAVPDPAAAPSGWEVEVSPDRDWYAVKATADTDPFPTDPQPRTIELRGHVAMIGRESASRGIHPDIDAGDDSAVSRRHAQLVHSGDEWQVVDLGSTNGTTIARAGQQPDADPLPGGQPVTLADGDSVLVGAWTRVTLRRKAAGASDPRS